MTTLWLRCLPGRPPEQLTNQSIHATTLASHFTIERQSPNVGCTPCSFVHRTTSACSFRGAWPWWYCPKRCTYGTYSSDIAPQILYLYHKTVEHSTYGIFSLGTPRQGSDMVDLARLILGVQLNPATPFSKIFYASLKHYNDRTSFNQRKVSHQVLPRDVINGTHIKNAFAEIFTHRSGGIRCRANSFENHVGWVKLDHREDKVQRC